jgi:hypothetical protein
MEMTATGQADSEVERYGRLATSLADQFAALYDSSPADPWVSVEGEMLTFAFQGGLSPADEWLLDSGRTIELREFREHFLHVVADQLTAVVEALTEFEVRRLLPAFDSDSRTTRCFFLVAPRSGEEGEERRAVLAWSEQVRRNARRLRERHRETREAHARLRDVLRDVRQTQSSDDD